MSSSLQHGLVKCLATLLKPLKDHLCPHSASNSQDFLNRLRNRNPFNGGMVSFDVSFFFTNVPLRETVDFIRKTLTECPDLIKTDDPEMETMSPEEVCALILMTVQHVDF